MEWIEKLAARGTSEAAVASETMPRNESKARSGVPTRDRSNNRHMFRINTSIKILHKEEIEINEIPQLRRLSEK